MADAPIPLIPQGIGPYQFRGSLGEGATSVVKLAFNKTTFQYFACKVVAIQHLDTAQRREKFENEIRIMQQLSHPNIVMLMDLLKDDNFYYIVMELCSKGELFDHIVEKKTIPETEAHDLMFQIISGVKFCHENGIAHRDLKPENILFDTRGRVKISDFGLSRISQPHALTGTQCGSPCYASPECLSGQPYDPFLSDIWACGVILYVMVTGQLPWTGINNREMFEQIKKGQYRTPAFLSDNCRDLIAKLMAVNPKERISLQDALNHRWMIGASTKMEAARNVMAAVSLQDVDKFFAAISEEERLDMASVGGALKHSSSLFDVTPEKTELATPEHSNLPPIEDAKRAEAPERKPPPVTAMGQRIRRRGYTMRPKIPVHMITPKSPLSVKRGVMAGKR